MLDIAYIRDYRSEIEANCKKRRVVVDVAALLTLDVKRRELIRDIDALRAERKKGSKRKPDDVSIVRMREVGERIGALEKGLRTTEAAYEELLARVPNLTHPDVPVGGEKEYRVISTHGRKPAFSFEAKDHETLLTDLDYIDFERGAKVSGAKFYFAKNDLVRLNMALLQYGMDIATRHGYRLLETPDIAKNEILAGIGFQPKGPETQVYSIEGADLSLIGTAEITVGGFHANEVLDLSRGSLRYAALSHCFRTEAGAYGRVSKGLYRVHQFAKLELFVFCRPEESGAMHEELLAIEKEIADGLQLHYRVIDVASGDLGAPAYRKFDLEASMVMHNNFGEITSASNCMDYQARNLNIKYRTADGGVSFVHTLNGTAIAISRYTIALIEQHQRKDGSVDIPKKLRPYLGKRRLSKASV